MAIISISGPIGAGKDTVARIIQLLEYQKSGGPLLSPAAIDAHLSGESTWVTSRQKWEIKKFATKLKQVVSMITGIAAADLEKEEVKNSLIGRGFGDMTYRKMLQLTGTEFGRQILGDDTWVNGLMYDYDEKSNWLVTDARFPNELEAVGIRGAFRVKVVRPGITVGTHPSETALFGFKDWDHIVENNRDMAKLCDCVYHMMERYEAKQA